MSFYELIIARRTVRQFKPQPIPREILVMMVNVARLAPSAANLQPLEFIIVDAEELRVQLFPCLKWAAYIAPDGNPKPGHEPMAYIIVLVNTGVKKQGFEYDAGAAIENMILTALERGVGSCWLLSVERDKIRRILEIPASYKIDSVLALGFPDEKPLAEEMEDSVKYWKDRDGRLHVPKRRLTDVIHFNKF